jgi:hypothetical protein
MLRTITLGDERTGIELGGNWRLKVKGKFIVEPDKRGMVVLRNKKHTFGLCSDGRYAYLLVWEQPFLFEPFLNLPWLRRMIGLRS